MVQFIKHKSLSTYDIHNILKYTEYEVDYKNVHKKIKNFISLGLIEKTSPNKTVVHGAIHYKLTSSGLFYLLSDIDDENLDLIN